MHPSSLLRQPDEESREREYRRFVADCGALRTRRQKRSLRRFSPQATFDPGYGLGEVESGFGEAVRTQRLSLLLEALRLQPSGLRHRPKFCGFNLEAAILSLQVGAAKFLVRRDGPIVSGAPAFVRTLFIGHLEGRARFFFARDRERSSGLDPTVEIMPWKGIALSA